MSAKIPFAETPQMMMATGKVEVQSVDMPVCPYCKTEMKPFNFSGYYDSFMGWACGCVEIPNAELREGQY